VTLDADTYVLGLAWSTANNINLFKGGYDGGQSLKAWLMTYPTFPNPASLSEIGNNKMSVYATYTVSSSGPTFDKIAVSTTENGTSCDFACEVTGANGGGFIFGTNNTGSWVNETWTALDADPHWANVTKTLNDTLIEIQAQWYANDSIDVWSASELFNVTVTYTFFDLDFASSITPLYYYGSGSYSMESPGVKIWNAPSYNSRGDLAYDTAGSLLLTHVNVTETIIPDFPIPAMTEPLMEIDYNSGGGSGYTTLLTLWAASDGTCNVMYKVNGADSSHFALSGVTILTGNRYVISAEYKIDISTGLVRVLVNGTVGYSITSINTIASVGVNHVEFGNNWGESDTVQYLYSATLKILAPIAEVVVVQGYIKNATGTGLANIPIQFGYSGTPNSQYLAYDVTNSTGGYSLQVNEGTYTDVKVIARDYGNSTDAGSITHFTNIAISGDTVQNFTLPSNTSTVATDLTQKTFWDCRGVTMFSWTFGSYDDASYGLALDDLTTNMTAVNTVEIRVYLYGSDSDVHIIDAWGSSSNAKTFNAMTADGINTAGTKGFKVFIGIVLHCPSNRFTPANPSTFFANYATAVDKYCTWLGGGAYTDVSNTAVNYDVVKWISVTFEPQVNFFVPAFNSSLQTLISGAKTAGGTNVTIGFHHQDMSDPAIPAWSGNWWHDADFVFGFGWSRMTYKLDPTYAELMAGWNNPPDWAYSPQSDPNWPATAAKYPNWQEYINAFTTGENPYLAHDIPAIINTGLESNDGANIYPWGSGPNPSISDEEEQASYFRTFFDFFDDNILGTDLERYGDLGSICASFCHEFAQDFIEKGLEAHGNSSVVVTITLPANTTYTTPTVSVQVSATGGTIDKIWWNCTFTNGTVVYANTVYTAPTSMTLGNGSYIFNARANNTLDEWDEETVTFTVEIASGPPASVTLVITSPTNTTYTSSTITISMSASGGTIDRIWWNVQFENASWLYAENQTYTVAMSIVINENVTATFYGYANNTDGNSDDGSVMFTVYIVPNTIGYQLGQSVIAASGFLGIIMMLGMVYIVLEGKDVRYAVMLAVGTVLLLITILVLSQLSILG
jgi:hypothetical protein